MRRRLIVRYGPATPRLHHRQPFQQMPNLSGKDIDGASLIGDHRRQIIAHTLEMGQTGFKLVKPLVRDLLAGHHSPLGLAPVATLRRDSGINEG